MALSVRVEHLQKVYGHKIALRDVSFHIDRGSVMGLVGPNGAGKSTLLKILLGLTAPTMGTVEYDGVPVWPNPLRAMQAVSGFVDSPSFYRALTGRQNLTLIAELMGLSANRVNQVLDFVDLKGAADYRAGAYSHGMQQRLGLASTMLKEPELLILDEPSDGLDPARLRSMRQLLSRVHGELGTTIILSSHMLDDVDKLCDAIAVFDQGSLRYFGPANQLGTATIDEVAWELWPPERAVRLLLTYGIVARHDGKNSIVAPLDKGLDLGEINSSLMKAGVVIRTVIERTGSLESRLVAYLEEFHVDAR